MTPNDIATLGDSRELPPDWRWARLSDIADVNPRTDLPSGGDVAFVPMAAVGEETLSIDVSERRPAITAARNYTRFRSGDVLFAKITPCMENGKVAIAPETPERVLAGSTEFHVIRPKSVSPKYLAYWIIQRRFRDSARRNMAGTAGQMRVPADYLRAALVPVPPRPIQDQVVASIERLFSEIDDGEAALARARADLEVYRRALLKAAVTGALTADWRAANPPRETGGDLLARILAERRTRWQADPKNRGKRYKEPVEPETEGLPRLPEGWVWASLDQLSWDSRYGSSEKCFAEATGTGVLRIPNVRAGLIDLTDMKRTVANMQLRSGDELRPGDLLVVRTNGSDDLIGRAGLVDSELKEAFFFASYLIRFRLAIPRELLPWVALVSDGPVFRAFVLRAIGTSAGQYNLSLSKLGKFAIPIPYESELPILISRSNTALQGMGAAHAEVDSLAGTQAFLRQSILAAAFRGELTA